jgi:hypothetical protein
LAGQAGNAELHIQVAFGLNFVFIWIAVLIVVEWIERFMTRREVKPQTDNEIPLTACGESYVLKGHEPLIMPAL